MTLASFILSLPPVLRTEPTALHQVTQSAHHHPLLSTHSTNILSSYWVSDTWMLLIKIRLQELYTQFKGKTDTWMLLVYPVKRGDRHKELVTKQ